MKIPAHLAAFAVAVIVLVLSTILTMGGHPVPAWWTWIAISATAGGLGLAVPPGLVSAAAAVVAALPVQPVTPVSAAPSAPPAMPVQPVALVAAAPVAPVVPIS